MNEVNQNTKFCTACGKQIHQLAEICPNCGVRVAGSGGSSLNKVALLLLTFFVGGFGGHKFYLKKYGQGVLYLLFFWTGIPGLVALVEFILYALKPEEELRRLYPATSGAGVVLAIVIPLVMVAFIGILAAIAIPQFASYRSKAFDSAAQSDLQNMHSCFESYFSSNFEYPASLEALSSQSCGHLSSGVKVFVQPTGDQFLMFGFHENGDQAYLMTAENTEMTTLSRQEAEQALEDEFTVTEQVDNLSMIVSNN
jgi:TM2 domain-containing membrane protein YozV